MSTQARGQAAAAPETPSRSGVGATLPLRVGFAPGRGLAELAARVEALKLGPGDAVRDLAVIVIDSEDQALTPAERERLAREAADHGAHVIDIATTAPTVDPLRINPTAFCDLDAAGYAAILSAPGEPAAVAEAVRPLGELARREPVLCLAPAKATLPPLPAGVERARLRSGAEAALRSVRERLGLIDHPAFHRSDWERAGWVVRMCAAGLPVALAEPSEGLRRLLGAELCELCEAIDPAELRDLDRRERLSVAIRRLALREHSVEARWRQLAGAAGIELPGRPLVSVVFATRREEWLEHGLAQVERQSYAPRELVCCLHGEGFAAGVEERVRAAVSGPVEVLRVDGELTLGDALNAGVAAAHGELVTKMDDDDYYDTEHLWDLVLACEYSQADLVGKGAEFVYLGGDFDLTIRRFMGDGESDHPRLAGGAMMARRGPLEAVGGWPRRNRGEDTWIVKNFQRAGRPTYRTHGFGYILNRHFRGHTWNTYIDYFLVQSQREWRGLRFDETAIR